MSNIMRFIFDTIAAYMLAIVLLLPLVNVGMIRWLMKDSNTFEKYLNKRRKDSIWL